VGHATRHTLFSPYLGEKGGGGVLKCGQFTLGTRDLYVEGKEPQRKGKIANKLIEGPSVPFRSSTYLGRGGGRPEAVSHPTMVGARWQDARSKSISGDQRLLEEKHLLRGKRKKD